MKDTSSDLQLVTLEEAARFASKTPHNVSDYIQRGRIARAKVGEKFIMGEVMPEYKVTLARSFVVTIQSDSRA